MYMRPQILTEKNSIQQTIDFVHVKVNHNVMMTVLWHVKSLHGKKVL